MDPIAVVLGPWGQLGISGAVVVALGLVAWRLWEYAKAREVVHDTETQVVRDAHLADVKAYADKYADILVENAKTQTALATAIERIGDKIK